MIWQLCFSENSLLGKQEAMFEMDGNTYVISNMGGSRKTDPVSLKNVGTRLSCDILKDITGQPVSVDQQIENTKSFISGNRLSVDCIEPQSGIAIDYLSEDFHKYSGGLPNKDVYEFYDRLALNQYKKEILSEGGINHMNIPYTIDHCDKSSDGNLVCDKNPSIKDRKRRLKEYLSTTVSDML